MQKTLLGIIFIVLLLAGCSFPKTTNDTIETIEIKTKIVALEQRITDLEKEVATEKGEEKEEETEEIEKEENLCYIRNIDEKNWRTSIDVDFAKLYLDTKEAQREAQKDDACETGVKTCISKSYYISNRNTKIRTFTLEDDVVIYTKTGKNKNETIPLSGFKRKEKSLYLLTTEGEKVLSLQEQNLP